MNQNSLVKRSIVFFLVPNFSMIAFATAIEPLRIANRMLGYDAYQWRLTSVDGKPVTASNGVECAVNASLEDESRYLQHEQRPSMVFVCSGVHVEEFRNKSVFAWLREEYNRGVAVGGLCTGAHILAAAGLLSGKRCAIHWENLPGFSEAFPKAEVYADLFEVDSNLYTCAGGTASLDMMLKLIGDNFDANLVNKICEQALTDRVRSPQDRQRLPLRARLGIQNSKVLTIIEMMEANLSSRRRSSTWRIRSASRAVRWSACSGRKWAVRLPVIISKSASTARAISCCNPPCLSWKLLSPAASFQRRIFPNAIANFTGVRHNRSALSAKYLLQPDPSDLAFGKA
ncbi:AraC family transcriptional regulator [Brucella vulpis]|nr:AraC family transcriptional regulator [Brucella vulpis]CUW50923.1 AraC family transcriptional regulator [Brucella vulpis]